MKKEVLVTFYGANRYEGETPDSIEFVTTGDLYTKGGNTYLKYTDLRQSADDEEGTLTTFKIEGDKVTILRFGHSSTQMVIERGKQHIGYYETPIGGFTIGVIADRVDIEMDETKGKIDLLYDVAFNNVISSKNKVCVTYETKEGIK